MHIQKRPKPRDLLLYRLDHVGSVGFLVDVMPIAYHILKLVCFRDKPEIHRVLRGVEILADLVSKNLITEEQRQRIDELDRDMIFSNYPSIEDFGLGGITDA